MNVSLILGYGVPKNMETDVNYRAYLGLVFNRLYTASIAGQDNHLIIPCGGKTGMFHPYRRTEAGEMTRLLKSWVQRPICRNSCREWPFKLENRSLSTLENLLFAKKILIAGKINSPITIFCEATRTARIRGLVKKIFSGRKIIIAPIDFDISDNRYLDKQFIQRKERVAAKAEQWALKSPTNMKKFHDMFVKKMNYLRHAGTKNQVAAVHKWWKNEINEFNKLLSHGKKDQD